MFENFLGLAVGGFSHFRYFIQNLCYQPVSEKPRIFLNVRQTKSFDFQRSETVSDEQMRARSLLHKQIHTHAHTHIDTPQKFIINSNLRTLFIPICPMELPDAIWDVLDGHVSVQYVCECLILSDDYTATDSLQSNITTLNYAHGAFYQFFNTWK